MSKSTLNKARHIKYWLRCLKTFLPTAFTSNDSQRMTFAFFTLSALDLLSALEEHTTEEERTGYIDWIYYCQHPEGGFKGFTGADGGDNATEEGKFWDPANLAATFFALSSLMVLGDDFGKVKRRECLEWVRGLQQDDGSFGEAKGRRGSIEGGGDVRWCYLAAAVRWMLRKGYMEHTSDINADALENYVKISVSYEGGIAKAPLHEAHAGWTYCGIGVLKLLGRLPVSPKVNSATSTIGSAENPLSEDLLRWLVSRQTSYLEEKENQLTGEESLGIALEELDAGPLPCAGFSGRCNKVADTCYAFWVGASLAMLHKVHLQDFNAMREYLLNKTQHAIGGFGKVVGDTPDILHSYLGLAALACLHDPDLRSIDPILCMSVRARDEFESKDPFTIPR